MNNIFLFSENRKSTKSLIIFTVMLYERNFLMNRRLYLYFFILIFLINSSVFSQNDESNILIDIQLGVITGIVIDATAKAPIEYANIVLFNSNNNNQITGGITNKTGKFELSNIQYGNYYLTVQFMGYEREVFEGIQVNQENTKIDLGIIEIQPIAINFDDVLVEGSRSPITYHIDKKVINVDEQTTVVSGNAADVLENVPSVTVDIEGNVSLRGSGSFTVLIDGRPTVLDAQDALQQIPATSIANIEIITNPSAKYNSEGTAGIINIILKEAQQTGVNGVINSNAGLQDKYGGDLLLEYRTGSVRTLFNIDYNKRYHPGERMEERITTLQDNTNFINSKGNYSRGRVSFGLRGGIEFNLSENNILGFTGRYGERERNSSGLLNFTEWNINNPIQNIYSSYDYRERSGTFFSLASNFLHKFNSSGHQLTADFNYSQRNSDEITSNEEIQNNTVISGKKSFESGPSKDFKSNIEYIFPFGDKMKFEAGYANDFSFDREDNSILDYDFASGSYQELTQYTNSTKYDKITHSVYSIYQDIYEKFGYQLGLRSEYTYQNIELLMTDEVFNISRWDYFPTAHISYNLSNTTQFMASYTRRIVRPRGWNLEPFLTWMNANNVRRGNPSLLPEFIDSYEIGAQTILGDVSVSAEVYYKMTNNKIEQIRSVYTKDVVIHEIDNVGKDYSLGTEFMFNFGYGKIWNSNLMGNLYDYRLEGNFNDEFFSRQSFNWSARFNNVLKFWESTSFQFNASYHSPTVSTQGRREGYFMTDAAVRQDLLDGKLSLTLQFRDLFGTRKDESLIEGNNFYNYNFSTRQAPMVMLNLRFNINNYKQERERRGGDDNGDMDDGDL